MDKTVSLIIPTYNERDNIIPLVERIHHALSSYDYRILFIDDDSSDGTAELATGLSPKYPVDVIVRKDQRGLASAVVDGLKHVTGGIVGVMDADLQHPPEILPDLLKEIEGGADIAIASRYVKGGACPEWGLVRRIISKGAISLAHILLPATRQIKDPMSGFFMFTRQAIADADLKPTGYKILLELLMQERLHNAVEVPYTFKTRSRGESKLNVRQQIDYLKHIYSLMRRTGELRRLIKFCLVGGGGVGVVSCLVLEEYVRLFQGEYVIAVHVVSTGGCCCYYLRIAIAVLCQEPELHGLVRIARARECDVLPVEEGVALCRVRAV